MSSLESQRTAVVDGNKIELAPLDVIDYAAIIGGDQAETTRLFHAAQNPGFFHLDLRGTGAGFNGQEYLYALKQLYSLQETYYSQPLETKMKDFVGAALEKGYHHHPDCETFELPYDALIARSPGALPKALDVPAVPNLMHASNDIVHALLGSLSASLRVEEPDFPTLETLHRAGEPSGSGMKLESVPTVLKLEDVPPSEHTDSGTLTLLYCDEYTTELRDGKTGEWKFIEPREGCAIVNVADALQKASKGIFKSALHRVGQPTEGVRDRRCVLYYLRPETSSGLYVC